MILSAPVPLLTTSPEQRGSTRPSAVRTHRTNKKRNPKATDFIARYLPRRQRGFPRTQGRPSQEMSFSRNKPGFTFSNPGMVGISGDQPAKSGSPGAGDTELSRWVWDVPTDGGSRLSLGSFSWTKATPHTEVELAVFQLTTAPHPRSDTKPSGSKPTAIS